ncbi:MAG: TonB-dependent receptor [Pseudomonadales bacterium]|nr:TonB-dependent receptor [Pseudomonadales bacterium]
MFSGQSLSGELGASAQSNNSVIPEIVVTATKEGEINLQEVPQAITVFDQERLENTGADNIEDLKWQTPGLNISRNGQAARLYMRGIGTNLDFVGSDPSVTVHVDGVYQSRPTSALEDFLDIERVEILRGPQGTLYGRNSTGGTINLITKLPENRVQARASIELGRERFSRVSAAVGGPLVDGTLMGRIALMKTQHDPYVENTSGSGIDGLLDDNSLSMRGALRWLMGDDSEVIVRADHSDIDRATGAYKATGIQTTGAQAPFASTIDQPSNPFQINISYETPFLEHTNTGTSAEIVVPLNESWTLVSLTGYRDTDFKFIEDTDGSALDVLVTEFDDQQDQISEEIRLSYKSERLNFVSGLYYLNDEHESQVAINVNIASVARQFDAINETTAYAVFGDGSFSLTDQLSLGFGMRYSKEEKSFKNSVNLVSAAAVVPLFDIDETNDWDSWSPKISLDYSVSEELLYYATISRGFKSGGYNLTASDAKYDPEYVVSYELGVKREWNDLGLRTNVAVFYYDYEDLQVQAFTSPGVLSISNAAEASVEGFEIENQWMPTNDWLFEFNFAFLDAVYDKYTAETTSRSENVRGNALNASPRRKLNLAAQYFQETRKGTLSYRLEYAWQTRQYFTAFNDEISSQATYGLLNARIMFNSIEDDWQLQLYWENLGDKAYSTSTREFPETTVGVTKDINPPRTFGAKLVYFFM